MHSSVVSTGNVSDKHVEKSEVDNVASIVSRGLKFDQQTARFLPNNRHFALNFHLIFG